MANVDNSCSNLEINGIYDSSKNIIEDIYNLQATTQRNVYNYTFETMNLRALMEFWHMNNHALLDEVLETLDALGGIKDGVGISYWKDMIESDILSDNDLIELKFELIDQLHFIMNMWVSINGDSKILDEMYTNMYGPLKMTGTNKLEDVDHTEHLLFGLKMTSAIHNATDSLGGSKSVGGNAIWKRWKAKYNNYESMYYTELSDDDKLVVQNNIVLVMGLFFKYCNSIGLYGEEIYNMYMSKNIENIRRQNDGY